MNNSKIFALSGPSGAGEDSIIEGLKKIMPIEVLITTTTRSPRSGESQGKPYYFISHSEFEKGITTGKFFEYAKEDGNNYYGCTVEEFKRAERSDNIIIWKVDYQGVINAKRLIPDKVIAILINVTPEVIERRIRKRTKVTEEFVRQRLAYANGWYENKHHFDYEISNEDGKLDYAIQQVADIIRKVSEIDK